ncbi:MAG: hypothetical protein ABIP79_03440 [Chitinophagaceae bacterium]
MKKFIVFVITLMILVESCNYKPAKTDQKDQLIQKDSTGLQISKDSTLLSLTATILTHLKNKEYSLLADYIDPIEGVRFSPYGYIDTVHNIIFRQNDFAANADSSKQKKIKWGLMDGSGEPILKKINEYIRTFVYDVDFLQPEKVAVNKFLGVGNSLNNLSSIYNTCDFTESYFSGFDKKYDGMDWRSLRLVFKLKDSTYYLVGIVHDQWTI